MLNVESELSCWHYFMFLKEHTCSVMLQQICVHLKYRYVSTSFTCHDIALPENNLSGAYICTWTIPFGTC